MFKAKKLTAMLMTVAAVTVLAGCNKAPAEDPTVVVTEAFNNMSELNSYAFDVSVDGSLADAEQSATLALSFSGSQDMSEPTDPKLNAAVDLTVQLAEDDVQKFKGEVRLTKTNLYFLVSELTDFYGQIPTEMVAPYLGQWWNVAIPEGTFDAAADAMEEDTMMAEETMEGDEAMMEEDAMEAEEVMMTQEEQMKELIKEAMVFGNLKYKGTKSGQLMYTGVLDKEALKNFIVKASELQGTTPTDEELAQFDEATKSLEANVEIWIDQDKRVVSKIAGDMEITVEDGSPEGVTMKVNFSSTLSAFDAPVTVEAPADAEEFDLGGLFGVPAYDDSEYMEVTDEMMMDAEL